MQIGRLILDKLTCQKAYKMETSPQLGTSLAAGAAATQLITQDAPQLKTLPDLLNRLKAHPCHSMQRKTAELLAGLLGAPLEKISIDDLLYVKPRRFKRYLKVEHHYSFNSRRTHAYIATSFLTHARNFGWTPTHSELQEAWQDIIDGLPKDGCREVAYYLIELRKTPGQVKDSDLIAYRQQAWDAGKSSRTQTRHINSFLHGLSKNGLAQRFPHLSLATAKHVHSEIPLAVLAPELNQDIEQVLQNRQKQYVPQGGKPIRQGTAHNIKSELSRLSQYVINVAGRKDVCRLPELFTKELIVGYISRLINERGLQPYAVRGKLRSMQATLKCHADYEEQKFTWLPSVIAFDCGSPEVVREGIRERKQHKFQTYETFLHMLDMMDAKLKEAEKEGGVVAAWWAHDRLLIDWWATFVWRQANIRNCVIDKNVFLANIPAGVNMAVPSWVRDEIKTNPDAKVWQIRFGPDEVKNKHHRRVVVPRNLATRLPEYLSKYRPLLVYGKDDPRTLFLNREGRRLTQCQFTDLVAKLTRDFTGKRSTPHIIRDIFADWWLRHHPADYLTLSKMLGHTNLQTTINSYAYKFDESAALCRVEEYREQHGKQPGSPAQAAVQAPSTKNAMVLVKAPAIKGYPFGPAAKAA
jgi:hypothetical protein